VLTRACSAPKKRACLDFHAAVHDDFEAAALARSAAVRDYAQCIPDDLAPMRMRSPRYRNGRGLTKNVDDLDGSGRLAQRRI